jgi:hypothetical protein
VEESGIEVAMALAGDDSTLVSSGQSQSYLSVRPAERTDSSSTLSNGF